MDLKIPEEIVLHKIFRVRGQKVMSAWLHLADSLDNDLAQLYDVEVENLMSHFATSSWQT